MPGIKLGKVRFNVSSDDLGFVGVPGGIFMLAWSILIFIFLLATLDQWRDECFPEDKGQPYFAFLVLALVSQFGLAVCFIWMTMVAFKGCVFEESKRRRASKLIIASCAFFAIIILNLIFGTISITADIEQCDEVSGVSEVMEVAVISSWVFVAIYVLVAILVYSLYPKSLDHPQHFEKFLAEISWLLRWNKIMWKSDESGSQPPIKRLALFMYSMFKDVDLTPTDMILSLLLVAAQQRDERKQHALKMINKYEQDQRSNASSQFQTTVFQESAASSSQQKEIELSVQSPKDQRDSVKEEVINAEGTINKINDNDEYEMSTLENKTSGDQLIEALQEVSEFAPSVSFKVPHEAVFLTPSKMYMPYKPDINPVLAADLFSPQGVEYVDRSTIELAKHYCKFALAIYVYGERKKIKNIMKKQGKIKNKSSVLRRMGSSQFWLSPILKRYGSRGKSASNNITQNGLDLDLTDEIQTESSIPHEGDRFPKQFVREMCDMADMQLEDLIYLTLSNDLEGVLPYLIAVDRKREAVVVSIRGSVSLADWITDAMFEPKSFEGFVSEEIADYLGISDVGKEYAHNGIFNCALAILKDLQEHKILDLLFRRLKGPEQVIRISQTTLTISLKDLADNVPDCSGWKLVLTGHSLGAGVASIMALKLKKTYPSTICWCFNPPGGLLSPNIAQKLSPICISIVQNKDLVSRLSPINLFKFRDKMVHALAACRWNKNRVWLCIIRGKWKRQQLDNLLWSDEQMPQEIRQVLTKYGQGREDVYQSVGQSEMIPPGRIAHIRYIKETRQSSPIYSAVWVSAKDLMMEGFLISPHVGTDHDQVNVMDVITNLQVLF